MIVYPNAKINIGLNIIEKRPDGFHNIESCFFPITLCDILEVIPNEDKVEFTSTGIEIPGSEGDNLCIKAWELLKNDFNIPFVKIHLHKQIPIGGGLGGGSADGAFMLKALNELFSLDISTEQLEKYAAQIGSDCAFFIRNKPAFATGKGEKLELIEVKLSSYNVMLINPGIHIPTAEAYSGITPQKPGFSLNEVIFSPISDWKGKVYNDFETSIFANHPEINSIKTELLEQGAEYAAMSGSGSSVFGLFKNEVPEKLLQHYKKAFIWTGKIKK